MTTFAIRQRTVAALVLLALTVAACGGSAAEPEPTTTTTTTTTPPISEVAPLTGLPAPPEIVTRPALVLKVDNDNRKARPQVGLDVADVVFEEEVEGGATRFAAVFHSRDADPVGPIRSARSTDLQLVANLGRPLFGFSGANNRVLGLLLREGDFVDVRWDAKPRLYFRRNIHNAPSNLYTTTASLYTDSGERTSAPPNFFSFREPAAPVAGGRPVQGFDLSWGGLIRLDIGWEWNAEQQLWLRSQQGTPHVVEDDIQLAAQNVIVQFTEYRASGDRDVNGAATPEATLVGSGSAWIFTGGQLIEGLWSRPEIGDVTLYTDQANQPVLLAPGTTWIELARPATLTVRE